MYSTREEQTNPAAWRSYLKAALHWLGSLKLAVILLATLGIVVGAATIVEADHGRAYAQWYVYHSAWFVALLGMLGMNICCAALSRFPWKRHQIGFVVTHLGLLVLLGGAICSFLYGVEGHVTLREGETTTTMTVPHQCQLTASWMNRTDEPPFEFTFEPGPADWRKNKTLHLGELDGLSATVLRYYSHAEAVEDWVPDQSEIGGPVLKLQVGGPHGSDGPESLLVDQDLGDEIFVGPIRVQLERAVSDAMLKDFQNPPLEQLGPKGVLLVYYQDHVARIAVADSIGTKTSLGDGNASIRITRYLPDARPDAHGRFESVGDDPRNPVVEFEVLVGEKGQPLRQMAFAKSPLLSLDPIYDRVCPVKCRYYHPVVKPPTSLEFLQARDGALHWRILSENKVGRKGVVSEGTNIDLPGNLRVTVSEYLRHGRSRITFNPVDVDSEQADKAEAAAEIALSIGGVTQTVWLQRNHATLSTRTVATPHGLLQVKLGYGELPLGYSLKLVEFQREANPGGIGNASYASIVRVIDQDRGVDDDYEISMNHPFTYNGLTFYQSGFNEGQSGDRASTFSVARDPGRPMKYAGSLMICLGIATMFYMRAYFFKNVRRRSSWFGFFRWRAAQSRQDAPNEVVAKQPSAALVPLTTHADATIVES